MFQVSAITFVTMHHHKNQISLFPMCGMTNSCKCSSLQYKMTKLHFPDYLVTFIRHSPESRMKIYAAMAMPQAHAMTFVKYQKVF